MSSLPRLMFHSCKKNSLPFRWGTSTHITPLIHEPLDSTREKTLIDCFYQKVVFPQGLAPRFEGMQEPFRLQQIAISRLIE